MTQPSYPHTIELPHSRPYSKKEFEGGMVPPEEPETVAAQDLAPSDAAPLDSHANDDNSLQAEQPGTRPVNPGSTVRIEVEPQ